jgi:RND family efflux transporter MFP subunit
MKMKSLMPWVLIGLAALAAAALLATREQLEPAAPEPVATVVRVIEVVPGPVQMRVHAQGTVEPRTQSALVPEVSGTVIRVAPSFVSGGRFTIGETLVAIDDRDYRSARERARASLARARAEHEHAEFELERARELEVRQLMSRADYESRLRSARVAEAAVIDAQLALEQAELDLVRTELRAPFTGVVRNHQVDVGQFVARGSAIANLYATDALEVRLPIADRQLAWLELPLTPHDEVDGARAPRVRLSAEFAGVANEWEAVLVRTEAEIDAASRMVHAVARLHQDGHPGDAMPPVGLFVSAEIDGRIVDEVIVLPRAALRDGNRVLIVDPEGQLRFRSVEVLRIYRDEVYVSAGLAEGELIAVSPLQTVVDGMRVRVIREHPEAERAR